MFYVRKLWIKVDKNGLTMEIEDNLVFFYRFRGFFRTYDFGFFFLKAKGTANSFVVVERLWTFQTTKTTENFDQNANQVTNYGTFGNLV